MNIILQKSDLTEGKIKIVMTDFLRIGVTVFNNRFIAFEDICSHDGEPISEGLLENNCIECPRHGAKFNIETGEALCMPATEDLNIFKMVEHKETVEIILEEA